jgi:hypothetical protein
VFRNRLVAEIARRPREIGRYNDRDHTKRGSVFAASADHSSRTALLLNHTIGSRHAS